MNPGRANDGESRTWDLDKERFGADRDPGADPPPLRVLDRFKPGLEGEENVPLRAPGCVEGCQANLAYHTDTEGRMIVDHLGLTHADGCEFDANKLAKKEALAHFSIGFDAEFKDQGEEHV